MLSSDAGRTNADASAPDGRRRAAASDRRGASRGGRRQTDSPGEYPPVLVADSDAGSRRVFTTALQRFGFQVLDAVAGEDALALAEAYTPAAVIAEATLPRDDDFQAYLRERRIPYIVTVTNDEGTVPADATAVLEKPFELPDLLREVFRVLRGGRTPAAV
jgi:CheY-like chemotaxis protein